jgi:hypothetical protein
MRSYAQAGKMTMEWVGVWDGFVVVLSSYEAVGVDADETNVLE